jgi:hypothetical protein
LDRETWKKLPSITEKAAEDTNPYDDEEVTDTKFDDDSAVEMDGAINFLLNGYFQDDVPLGTDTTGSLESKGAAESLADEEEMEMEKGDYFAVHEDGGRGKRHKAMSQKVRDIQKNLK